jgi:hypothetical protein
LPLVVTSQYPPLGAAVMPVIGAGSVVPALEPYQGALNS